MVRTEVVQQGRAELREGNLWDRRFSQQFLASDLLQQFRLKLRGRSLVGARVSVDLAAVEADA